MAYIGKQPAFGTFRKLDDITPLTGTSSYALALNGTPITPKTPAQLMVSVNGVIQEPDVSGTDGFKVSGSNIVFSTSLTTGDSVFIVQFGDNLNIGQPSSDSVVADSFNDQVIFLNGATYNDITINAGRNGSVTGPITVSGTITIESGATFVII